jgi:TIR domain
MPHLFFFSYARANTKRTADSDLVRTFREALEGDVEQLLGNSADEICFFDGSDIEAGAEWPITLADALRTSRVALCLYSPHYFNSRWSGKELQVFLDRAANAPGPPAPTPLIPVIWTPALQGLPAPVQKFQTHDATFPESYSRLGLRQVMNVGSKSDFYLIVNALAHRIVSAVQANALPPLAQLDLDRVVSVWDAATEADPASHKKGGITKTCFVFAARQGWDWRPYAGEPAIGALAQTISGQLGLKYEEIPCDAALPTRLRETHEHDVPTVVFADPSSAAVQPIEGALQSYDQIYFLNCGLIVPWERPIPSPATDPRWFHIQRTACPQKAAAPPPYHDWLSTVSPDDLKARSAAVIEAIRGQLLKKALGSETAVVSKAENAGMTNEAEQNGVRLDIAPQLAPALGV